MLTPLVILVSIATIIGIALLLASGRIRQKQDSPIERVNQLLPQSQCGQCGYPGCRPYAEAIVNDAAGIDQCAPGGDATVTAIAKLLGKPTTTVNPNYGTPGPLSVAVIDEDVCIGCALCLNACPIDAIIGAARFTHTVVRKECTGCELCIAPCPVDCIQIVPVRQRNRPAAAHAA